MIFFFAYKSFFFENFVCKNFEPILTKFVSPYESRRGRRQEAEVPSDKNNILLQVRLQTRQEDKPLSALQLLRLHSRNCRDDFSERLLHPNKAGNLRANGDSILSSPSLPEFHASNLDKNVVFPDNARRSSDSDSHDVSLHPIHRTNPRQHILCLFHHRPILHRVRWRAIEYRHLLDARPYLYDSDFDLRFFHDH